tara:strand:+ start:87 stop:698 length:612 start_codon:yes stop_codon:yes gene_type:complete
LKNFKNYLVIIVIISFSCNKEDNFPVVWVSEYNLFAPDSIRSEKKTIKKYIKYSLSEEDTVSHDKWDIGFKGSKIIINGGFKTSSDEPERTGIGGVYIIKGKSFASIKEVEDGNVFIQDQENSLAIKNENGKGWWYLKDLLSNILYPIKNNVLIIKTHNGRYAKLKIDSYYKDSPEEPNFRSQSSYYSFVYWYQPNKDIKSFE